jgi:hypothetical protein
VIDLAALQIVLMALIGWLDGHEREALANLIEENRVLRRQLGNSFPHAAGGTTRP